VKRSFWGRLVREPLVQFLVIGVLLFVANAWFQPEAEGDDGRTVIELSEGEIDQLLTAWYLKWQRQPTPAEVAGLVEARLREEVLSREALALGLDKDDEIIRRRLAQKMDFLLGDMAAVEVPTTEVLEAWYAENGALFRQEPRSSLRHLYFSPDRRGGFDGARHAAEAALREIVATAASAEQAAALADRFMFQDYYADRTVAELAGIFGPAFAQGVLELDQGSWQGPVESGLGWHLVWVDQVTPARVPAFAEIEPEVERLWLAEQRELAKQRALDEIWSRYDFVLPVAESDAADAGSGS